MGARLFWESAVKNVGRVACYGTPRGKGGVFLVVRYASGKGWDIFPCVMAGGTAETLADATSALS